MTWEVHSTGKIPDISTTESARRFPTSWRANKIPGGYVARYANSQAHPTHAKVDAKVVKSRKTRAARAHLQRITQRSADCGRSTWCLSFSRQYSAALIEA
jgi:hypothetical protein